MTADTPADVGAMVDAVNAHVLDHVVNGPVAHRALMDAAETSDALVRSLRQQIAELVAALREIMGSRGHVVDAPDCVCPMHERARAALADAAAVEDA